MHRIIRFSTEKALSIWTMIQHRKTFSKVLKLPFTPAAVKIINIINGIICNLLCSLYARAWVQCKLFMRSFFQFIISMVCIDHAICDPVHDVETVFCFR